MKYLIFSALITLLFACQPQTADHGHSHDQVTVDLPSLKSALRDSIKALPRTNLDKSGELSYQKAYSFDIEPSADGSTILWTFPEKHYGPDSNNLSGGGKYFLVFDYIDLRSIKRGLSPDSTRQGIIIKAFPGASFAYEPFGPDSTRILQAVELGWWDRKSDASVGRVLKLMGQVGEYMNKYPAQAKAR